MKNFTLGLILTLSGLMISQAQAAGTKVSDLLKSKRKAIPTAAAPIKKTAANFQFGKFGIPTVKNSVGAVDDTQPECSAQSSAYGFLNGPDGTQWYFTQDFEEKDSVYEGGYRHFYKYLSSTVNVYDSSCKLVGTLKVELPDNVAVNQIEPYGYVTSNFFDKDKSTYEITVGLHFMGTKAHNYTDGGNWTRAYSLTDGSQLYQFEGNGVWVFNQPNSWTTYQRIILPSESKGMVNYDILAPVNYSHSEPYIDHTFSFDSELQYYDNGANLNIEVVNDEVYYVISHYEKPYVEGETDITEDITVTSDNTYDIISYDSKYNKVDSFSVPLVVPEEALYRFGGFGLLYDHDMSYDHFVSGKRAYVIKYQDYITSIDSDIATFVVFDQDGNEIETICDDVFEDEFFTLSSVNGFSEQMAFLQYNDGVQRIKLVNVPSCELETYIPARINNDAISTTFDRYPVGDSYQYVMRMATGDLGEDGKTLLARIGWYTRDLTLDHMVYFDLGENGEYFTPLLNSLSLNPYLFDTDNDLDYIYIAKKSRNDGTSKIDNVLEVAHGDGTIFKSFHGDNDYSISSPAVIAMTESSNKLLLSYMGDDDYKIDFYDLPFIKFEKGGDGSESNPYQIASAGDLNEIRNNPAAHYEIVNDIDMQAAKDWVPIDDFTGTLEGNNHSISNLHINTNEYNTGLFCNISGDSTFVKNVNFVKPTVKTTSTGYVGILAAKANATKIENIHIYDATVSAPQPSEYSYSYGACVGGLVAQITRESKVIGCSFDGDINAPYSQYVGGIAGQLMTGDSIMACAASGTIVGKMDVGGIIGNNFGAYVFDCHANVDITGLNDLGGIVGCLDAQIGRGMVIRCYATGSITSTGAPKFGRRSLGGIVGYLQGNYSFNENYPEYDVDACVAGVNITTQNITSSEQSSTKDSGIHRVIGWTAYNEWEDDKDGSAYEEKGIRNNYALSTVTINGDTTVPEGNDDASTVYGKTIAESDINSELLVGIGYAYGNNVTAPWVGKNGLPSLYFENQASTIGVSESTVSLGINESKDVTITVYGGSADDIESITSADNSIATAEITETSGNQATVKITAKAVGSTTISIVVGDMVATISVKGTESSGISNIAADGNLAINAANGIVSATGAKAISIYSTSGQLVAAAASSTVATSQLPSGIYVVVATDAQGNKTTAKFAIK